MKGGRRAKDTVILRCQVTRRLSGGEGGMVTSVQGESLAEIVDILENRAGLYLSKGV